MRKAYLFVYSNDLGTRQEVKRCIDSLEEIIYWRYDMPNSFYLISESTAQKISDGVRAKLGKKRFFITEITDDNKQGFLPRRTWDLINRKSR